VTSTAALTNAAVAPPTGKNDSIELGDGHVDGGPEPGQGAEEAELDVAGADPQRRGDLGDLDVGRLGRAAARIAGQLLV
jgi:hypothetical protein